MYRKTLLLLTVSALLLVFMGGASMAAEPIKIASIFSKSGEAGPANLHHVEAVRYAVEEINANGGLLGRPIEVVEIDNKSTSIQSKIAAIKAVKAGVVGVIGASWSDHSLAMAPVFQKAKIPMIAPDSTNVRLTLIGDFIFRACFIDPFQGQVLAGFAVNEFQAKTASIMINIGSTFSMGLAKTFAEHFEAMGGRVLGQYDYEASWTDYSKVLKLVKNETPDILFIPGHVESGTIVQQAETMGVTALMMGGDGWGNRTFMTSGGGDLKEGYYIAHWTPDMDSEKSKHFVKQYRQTYELNDSVAVVYDAVMLLAEAIRTAGTVDGEAVRNALAATKNFEGVTGTISFDANGNPVKSAVILKIDHGKITYHKTVQP